MEIKNATSIADHILTCSNGNVVLNRISFQCSEFALICKFCSTILLTNMDSNSDPAIDYFCSRHRHETELWNWSNNSNVLQNMDVIKYSNNLNQPYSVDMDTIKCYSPVDDAIGGPQISKVKKIKEPTGRKFKDFD